MRTIWKFTLGNKPSATVNMPRRAEVLTAQFQDDVVTLWAEVDSEHLLEERHFRIFGTGWDMAREIGYEGGKYIATVQRDGFVWHVYEVTGG